MVCKLLFLLAHWHGLAKLRMHIDDTLELMEGVSRKLGSQLRMFVDETCPAFSTRELHREAESRRRRQAQEGERDITQTRGTLTGVTGGRRPKVLNLCTYKLHALGDYPTQIRMYGTTDSYSTQLVMVSKLTFNLSLINSIQGELEHRTSKGRYMRTSHKAFIPQLAAIERRQARIRRIRMQQQAQSLGDPTLEVPEQHHVISKSQNFPEDIHMFLSKNSDDPAMKVSPSCIHYPCKIHRTNLDRISFRSLGPTFCLVSAISIYT